VPDVQPRFIVTGKTGKPNPLADVSFGSEATVNAALEVRPTLRLRAKRGTELFQPGQPAYGGMEFTIAYLKTCINSVEAFPATEAADATAVVGPVLGNAFGYDVVKAVVIDPKGFSLTYLSDTPPNEATDETLAGEGPLVDIVVNWKATTNTACRLTNPALIQLGALSVSDVDGNEVFAVPGTLPVDTTAAPVANAVFRTYAVDLPPPPPGPSGC
jgi:hypothetical protein